MNTIKRGSLMLAQLSSWWAGYWTFTHWGTCRTVNLFYKLPLWFWGHLAMLVNLFYLYSCILLWDYICLTKKMWMHPVGNVHRPFCAFRPVYRLLPMSQCTYCVLAHIWCNIAQWSRNQLWIGGAKVDWEGWTKTTLISNEINKDRIHTYRLQWAN